MATLIGNGSVGVKGEANTIFGDTAGTADPATHVGNDTLTGGANSPNNTIYGDADTLMGAGSTGGNDTLIGGVNSTNTLVGDSNHMEGAPTGGNDTLIGGRGGTNTLVGDAIDFNGAPTGGNDRLVSAAHTTDNMWGDFQTVGHGNPQFGSDTFAFGPHNGNDFIYDFSAGGVGDFIELSGFDKGGHALTSFADLTIQVMDTTGPSGVPDGINDSVIQLSNNDSVTVVDFVGLAANDFMFV